MHCVKNSRLSIIGAECLTLRTFVAAIVYMFGLCPNPNSGRIKHQQTAHASPSMLRNNKSAGLPFELCQQSNRPIRPNSRHHLQNRQLSQGKAKLWSCAHHIYDWRTV